MKTYTLQELQASTRNGIGLVIGPDLTENLDHEKALCQTLGRLANISDWDDKSFLEIADSSFESDKASGEVIKDIIHSHFANPQSASPEIHRLLSANLKAVVSLVFDPHFKSRYVENYESKPVGKMLATIASPSDRQPPGSLPFFALLGDPSDERDDRCLVVSQSDYISRKATWPTLLRSLPDSLLGDPLFFLGLNSVTERMSDFLSALLSLGPTYPRKLIFLAGDPVLGNSTLLRVLETKFDPHVLNANLRDVGDAFSKETLSVKSLPLWSLESESFLSPDLISRVDDRLSYVPKQDELHPNPDRRNKHLDSLFRPTHLDWDPYALNLPFERDANSKIIDLVENLPFSGTLRFGGDAGIGKTVMLRKAAFDLAQGDVACFWFRRFFDNPPSRVFNELIREFNSEIKEQDKCIYFFLDDPIGTRVSEEALCESLQAAKFRWKLIVCQRTSEAAIARGLTFDHVLPTEFTKGEIERFSEYRASLGIDEDESAEPAVKIGAGTPYASDILCNLWYSLPQTKAALSAAISDEYDRLIGVESIIEAFVSSEGHTSMNVARSAYEMVTVCSSLGNIGLPVEVLVSALGIGYEEWASYSNEGAPVWGLIYDEECPAIESWVYRTRNHVVTEILVRHFNKGSSRHSQEFRSLLKLIKGCSSGSAPYRQFLLDVLVSNRRQIEERFDLERAMELYETALEVYPRKIGKVEFHHLICKRHLGGDSLEVYDELSDLIGRSRRDKDEYDTPDKLETSAAATMLKAYREEKVTGEEASEAIYRHITTALGYAPHSLFAIHTQANSLLKIGADMRSSNATASVENVIRAANLIERSMMTMDVDSLFRESEIKDYNLFVNLRDEYLAALPESDDLKGDLFGRFEKTDSQVFLVMASRIELGKALKAERGKLFKAADECISRTFRLLNEKGQEPDVDLIICRVQLNFEWNLRRSAGPVYWEGFKDDLNAIRSHRRFREDPFWDFLLGVCAFHLKDYSLADQSFSRLRARRLNRRFERKRRCTFHGDTSSTKTLEGTVSIGAEGNAYIYCAEIGTDIRGERGKFKQSKEEIKFFQIEFSMMGPIAVPLDS